jgi:hypothetical protein
MTADAALAGHHGLMLKPHTLGFFVDILVALIADLIAWLLENELVIRGMGFVHFKHSPRATILWLLRALAGKTSLWQLLQSSEISEDSSILCEDVCGLWQSEQLPVLIGE